MPLVLLALVLLFLIPWLGIMLLVFFLFLFLLVPLGFAARSFAWIIIGPRELFRILADREVRKNHALEHATINVIEQKSSISRLTGMAFRGGFSVNGLPDPQFVLMAAREAHERLSRGERDLAISRNCGTTVVVVNTISAFIFLFILFLTGKLTLLPVIVSLSAAYFIGPLASPTVQRFITTDPQVRSIEITGVETRSRKAGFAGASFYLPSEVFVATRIKGKAAVAEVVDQ